MKIRSALLVACLLVVPAFAMFSHRIPATVRQAVREAVMSGLARWQRPAVAASREPSPPASAEAVVPPAESPPTVVQDAAVEEPSAGPPSALRLDLEQRLQDLGGMAFDCRPMQGFGGTHVASCRVPLDSSGQLMRVFQASGSGADEATRTLVADVAAWKQRMALRGPPGPTAAERRRF